MVNVDPRRIRDHAGRSVEVPDRSVGCAGYSKIVVHALSAKDNGDDTRFRFIVASHTTPLLRVLH